jgi:Ca2+-binding EF-hand superfamily protein
MKAKPFHFPAVATLALVAVLTTSASARRGGDDDGGNDDSPADDAAKFAAADADDSGSLTLAEFTTTFSSGTRASKIAEKFAKADTDRSSAVSLAEWTIYKDDSLPDDSNNRPRAFDLADVDTSGTITPDEFAGFFKPGTKPSSIMKKFDKYDRNDSSTLTRDEWNPGKRGGS